jgi:DNA-directed RNA polymerase
MQTWSPRIQSPELARLPLWDSSRPLVLHETIATPTMHSKGTYGAGGEPVEMHQNLYACLRVGRLDRAGLLLARLSKLYEASAPEIVDAHNIFLQTLFEHAQQDPQADSLAQLEKWYDANMGRRGVAPNAQTFVTLLRAAMSFLDEGAQEAAIRRYMAMAHEHGEDMVEEINYASDFTDEEWHALIHAQPDEFEEPPPVLEVQERLVNSPAARQSLVEHGLMGDPTQQIKPVAQKGLGLDSLHQAMAIFTDTQRVAYPDDMAGSRADKDQAYAYARQLRMEQDAMDAAVNRWRQEDEKLQKLGIHGVMNTKPVQALMYNWYAALIPLFKKQIEHCKSEAAEANSRDPAHTYGPWLERCDPAKLAAMTVSRAVQNCVRGKDHDSAAFKVSAMSINIGNDFRDYLNADAQSRRDSFLKKHRRELRKQLVGQLSRNLDAKPQSQPQPQPAAPTATPIDKVQIPLGVRTSLGALAIELLLQSATITVTADDPKTGKQLSSHQAAFSHHVGYRQGKKVGIILPHPQVLSKLRNEPVQHIQAVKLPMVVEPKPWTGFEQGGYYTVPQPVVRQKNGDASQKAYAQSAIENGDMTKVLAGLDVLGKVPWQINAAVLDVMATAWNQGGDLGGLIPEETDLKPPEEPPADANYQQRARYGKKLQEYENVKSGLHSQRCFQNFQLETARAFVQEKKIFFPHSVDFRGRAYPVPPILNHIGSDLARGLLKFAHGKELGTVGLQWLKIHLANLYGFDKASMKEREQFAMDNISEIYDSATNPLGGRRWWAKAEDPWQCLACCMELQKAFDSPDPTRFVSQLPVHQDGTCNGLQHYAALGGDHAGARQVNLEPSDRPQDIYTGVAELVKEMVAKEAAQGLALAKFMDGHITRKVVKRTVMTNVYGVTFMGAKQQVEDELREMFPNFSETDTVKSLGSVALYIAYKIFEALGKIFNGAQEIQYWLGECGDRITTSLTAEQIQKLQARYEGKPIEYDAKFKKTTGNSKGETNKLHKGLEAFKTSIIWTTPLKMPIVQPYRKDSLQKIKTKIQDITVIKRAAIDAVDKRKQLQAFPPNFIHSLDATHMTLSALKCAEIGLDFAAVHDSFWTHASDIPNLNVILRDAFVRMHSEDIVERLSEEFKARYAGAMYTANIRSMSPVGIKIRKWRVDFFRAKGKNIGKDPLMRRGLASFDEVALESKRRELLNSKSPEDVKKGQAMVTPTSIWLENPDPKALSSARMSLLGETKAKSTSKYAEVRDKVLDREAEVAGISPTEVVPSDSESASELMAEAISQSTAADTTPDTEVEASSQDSEPGNASQDIEASADAEEEDTTVIKSTIQAWLPLTFPPVPQKGGWDVSRLRESKYFFS